VRRPSYSVKPSNYCKMRPLYTLGFLILSFFSYAQTPTIISNHIYVYQRKDLDIIEFRFGALVWFPCIWQFAGKF
jgi:hypothetical protein